MKFMVCKFNRREVDHRDMVKLGDYHIQEVTSFKYLRIIIQNKGKIEEDLNHKN